MFSNIRHILHFNVDYSEGASINDVRKNFGFFYPLPPLSANSRNLPYQGCLLCLFLKYPLPLSADVLNGSPLLE